MQSCIPSPPSLLDVHTLSHAISGARFVYTCPLHIKFLHIVVVSFITLFGSRNIDAQYKCMCSNIEFTKNTLPAYERFLDPHVLTLEVSLSTSSSQSPNEILFSNTGTPKYLRVIYLLPSLSPHTGPPVFVSPFLLWKYSILNRWLLVSRLQKMTLILSASSVELGITLC